MMNYANSLEITHEMILYDPDISPKEIEGDYLYL